MPRVPVLALTPGEPAGIGPDLIPALARRKLAAAVVVIADRDLLHERAQRLGAALTLPDWNGDDARPGLYLQQVALARPVTPGRPDPANAAYVLQTLDAAIDGCTHGRFDALVTGPVHKGTLNDAGHAFTGHTEYLAERTRTPLPVMMLASADLRVALVTTHLPLTAVPAAVTRERLRAVLDILHADLRAKFAIDDPRILVCGLNPHAGEGGHLGREEIDVIEPVLAELRGRGFRLTGPVPADTAFLPHQLTAHDAVLAMYHDQGLPVLKHHDFAHAVNITLGLPFTRTSVDHGTALELVATGRADPTSLFAAVDMAVAITAR